MDSTGLKIYGEGKWKVRTHGKSKRRIWRKLHRTMDRHSGEIQAAELTEAEVSDEANRGSLAQANRTTHW